MCVCRAKNSAYAPSATSFCCYRASSSSPTPATTIVAAPRRQILRPRHRAAKGTRAPHQGGRVLNTACWPPSDSGVLALSWFNARADKLIDWGGYYFGAASAACCDPARYCRLPRLVAHQARIINLPFVAVYPTYRRPARQPPRDLRPFSRHSPSSTGCDPLR